MLVEHCGSAAVCEVRRIGVTDSQCESMWIRVDLIGGIESELSCGPFSVRTSRPSRLFYHIVKFYEYLFQLNRLSFNANRLLSSVSLKFGR